MLDKILPSRGFIFCCCTVIFWPRVRRIGCGMSQTNQGLSTPVCANILFLSLLRFCACPAGWTAIEQSGGGIAPAKTGHTRHGGVDAVARLVRRAAGGAGARHPFSRLPDSCSHTRAHSWKIPALSDDVDLVTEIPTQSRHLLTFFFQGVFYLFESRTTEPINCQNIWNTCNNTHTDTPRNVQIIIRLCKFCNVSIHWLNVESL